MRACSGFNNNMNATTTTTATTDFYISDLSEVFADLAPGIPQDDGPADAAVCKIDYPAAFVLAFDYFRAILQRQEYSPRALRLTTLCLQQNPANYTYAFAFVIVLLLRALFFC
jgi:hypothetical protein